MVFPLSKSLLKLNDDTVTWNAQKSPYKQFFQNFSYDFKYLNTFPILTQLQLLGLKVCQLAKSFFKNLIDGHLWKATKEGGKCLFHAIALLIDTVAILPITAIVYGVYKGFKGLWKTIICGLYNLSDSYQRWKEESKIRLLSLMQTANEQAPLLKTDVSDDYVPDGFDQGDEATFV